MIFNPKTKEFVESKSSPMGVSDESKSPAADRNPSIGETEWIIFNDNKVNISEKPPIPFAYIYVYKRLGASQETGHSV